jgi:hypothetical protein
MVSNLKDCRGFVIKIVKIKINLIKRRLIWFVKDCRDFVIKFVRIKINLIKRRLIWFVTKVHKINVKLRVNI